MAIYFTCSKQEVGTLVWVKLSYGEKAQGEMLSGFESIGNGS